MKKNIIIAIVAMLVTVATISLYDAPKHHWSRSGSNAYLNVKGSVESTEVGIKWYIKEDNVISAEEIKCCYKLGVQNIWIGDATFILE